MWVFSEGPLEKYVAWKLRKPEPIHPRFQCSFCRASFQQPQTSRQNQSHADKLTEDGQRRVVRHGHLPERKIATGIGRVGVRQPRVRDRGAPGSERIRFSPSILPPYARRSKSLEVLIPILHLKGISTGDFAEALAALVGRDAGGLSASTIARLKEIWADEHARWLKRDLSAKQYVYLWVDGIHVQARLEDEAQCILVIIGATPDGKKELVGLADGVRESALSWKGNRCSGTTFMVVV